MKQIPYGYIYKILNLLNGKVYIGLTKKTPLIRFHTGHWNNKKSNKKSKIQNALKYNGVSNFLIKTLCECYSEEDLNQSEKIFIEYFKSNKIHKGYNQTSGGQSGLLNQSVKDKISKANKGHKHSDKTKKLISDKNFKKQVICLNDNKKFKSVTEAANYYKIQKTIVSFICINKKNQTRKGLKFRFLTGENIIIKHSEETKRKIGLKKCKKLICLDTKEVFNSAKEAGEKMNLSKGLISKVCNGLRNHTGGFKFKWIK
jgi:hypothetical protein